MNKHWEKATEEQVEWADEHGYVIAPEECDLNSCRGCAVFPRRSTIGRSICENTPCLGIIFKSKETKMSKKKVKIVQIMPDPQGGGILGLGSDGVVYGSNFSTWQIYLPAKFKDEQGDE